MTFCPNQSMQIKGIEKQERRRTLRQEKKSKNFIKDIQVDRDERNNNKMNVQKRKMQKIKFTGMFAGANQRSILATNSLN